MAATDAVGQSDVLSLVARFGNEIVQEQISNDVPILKTSVLKKVPMKGKKAVFNVIAGGLDSTTWISDHDTLPTGSGFVPLQGEQSSAAILGRLSLGHQALWNLTGADDSADLVEYSLRGAASDVARQLGRGLFDSQLNPDGYVENSIAPVAGVYTDVDFKDVSGFREGQAVILYDVSADQTFCLEVTKITPSAVPLTGGGSANVAGFVTLSNTVKGISTGSTHENGDLPTIASADLFYQRGRYDITGNSGTATDQSNVIVSFADVASASTTLHGISPSGNGSGYGWTGITASSFGVLTQEALSGVAMRVLAQSGKRPSHLVLNPAGGPAYAASGTGTSTPFGLTGVGTGRHKVTGADFDVIGDVLDDYESGLAFMGKPVLLEPNCPAAQAVMPNKAVIELGVWKEPGPFDQGGDNLLINQSNFAVDVQIAGAMNLMCRQRRAMALITGISSL